MNWCLQRNTTDGERQNVRSVSMYNSIHMGKFLVDFAVYASFREPVGRILLHGLCILNLILNYILGRLHECWRKVPRHIEGIVVVGIAD